MRKTRGFSLIGVIIIIIITSLVASMATGVIMINNSSNEMVNNYNSASDDDYLQEFITVYNTLVDKYYDSIDRESMLNAAEEAMVSYLGEKYTTYLDDEEYNEIIDELSGTYNGIGVSIQDNKIVDVTKDSPAAKAGLQIDDEIMVINGVDTEELSNAEIGKLIRESKSNTINMKIKRKGELITFDVTKEELIYPSIKYEVLENTNIGYIYINNFSQNLGKQMNDALKELEGKNITSLIVDVRDNVGGYLSAAEDVSSIFIEKGKVIYSLESNNGKYVYKDKTAEKREYPIVVLINGNSASASEILAAALKESYGAIVVGEKSYGKGKVQQVVSLNNGGSVKYTSAKWLTPGGKCIDGIGISPDYEIKYEKQTKYDSQVNKGIELLNK
jgi:carboxyl-terminal processing protease